MTDQSQAGSPAERRRARVWWLRRRVIAVSLACAVLFFGVITIRMAIGQDPIFGGGSGESTATTATATRSEGDGGEATRGLFGEGSERGFGGDPGFGESSESGSGESLESLHTGQS